MLRRSRCVLSFLEISVIEQCICSRPVILTGDKSRRELEIEYGRQIVAQSLTVWNGLTKAVEKDRSIADIVVRAKAPSKA